MEAPFGKGDPSLGEAETTGVATGRRRLDGGPTRVAQPEQPGHLVEAFSGRIVAAAAQAGVGPGTIDADQLGVAAADQQHEVGTRRQGVAQVHRAQMPLQVVHPQEGLAMQPRQGAGRDRPHQQGPGQAGGDRGGDGIEIGHGQTALLQHPGDQGRQRLHVAARGDLRHHPAPAGVLLHLGGHGPRQHPPTGHDRRR